MGYLAEVVDFCPAVDDGGAHGGTVDAGVGANLDIVLNHHVTNLVNLAVGAVVRGGKAEAVGTHHHAGVEDAVVAHLAFAVDFHSGIEDGVVAYLAVVAHIHLGVYLNVVAYLCMAADKGKVAHVAFLS